MARRSYSRDDVETHDGADRPAVNVKVYTSMDHAWRDWPEHEPDADPRFTKEWIEENISEESLDWLFWHVCEFEFEYLADWAAEIFKGYRIRVERDGRSGGWAVVTGLPSLEEWDAVLL